MGILSNGINVPCDQSLVTIACLQELVMVAIHALSDQNARQVKAASLIKLGGQNDGEGRKKTWMKVFIGATY